MNGKPSHALAAVLALLLPVLAVFFTTADADLLERSELPTAVVSDVIPTFEADNVSDDVLWLARGAYSETKEPHEQELVAWVLRNRVETGYRGQNTFEGVVLDPYQFSAFNPGSSKRRLYMSLTPESDSRGWQRALEIAHTVYYSSSVHRPFPQKTRHFYSERSMVGGRTPNWAEGEQPVRPVGYTVDPRRFRFYSGLAATFVRL